MSDVKSTYWEDRAKRLKARRDAGEEVSNSSVNETKKTSDGGKSGVVVKTTNQ